MKGHEPSAGKTGMKRCTVRCSCGWEADRDFAEPGGAFDAWEAHADIEEHSLQGFPTGT